MDTHYYLVHATETQSHKSFVCLTQTRCQTQTHTHTQMHTHTHAHTHTHTHIHTHVAMELHIKCCLSLPNDDDVKVTSYTANG